MVKQIALLLLFFSTALPAAQFEVQLDRNRVEQGKFLIAELIYRGPSDPGLPDLTLWQDDFFVDAYDPELADTADGGIEWTQQARLYPRRQGRFSLDAIATGGAIARPQSIEVLAPLRGGIDITPDVQPLQPAYWADQTIIVSLDMPLHDPRNEVIANDFETPHFRVTRLPDQRLKTAQGISMRLRWMLLSPRKGHYQIELPAIVQRGRGRFRFYLPPIKVQIQPLPAYLSPAIPVGKPAISHRIEQQQHLKILHLEVRQPGRLPETLSGFSELQQALGIDDTAVRIDNSFSDGVAIRQYEMTLPRWLMPRRPSWKLAYFDTERGQADRLDHKMPLLWQWPHVMTQGLVVGGLLLLMLLAWRVYPYLHDWRQRRKLRQQIMQAQTACEIRQLLLAYSGMKTLQQWTSAKSPERLRQLSEWLDRACFAATAKVDLKKIKTLARSLV